MACTAAWLVNDMPNWAAHRAVMACYLVALKKCPGTHPVGIGSVFKQLLTKTILLIAGGQATMAFGNKNLCTGLPIGIEGAVHMMMNTHEPVDEAPTAAPCTPEEV